MTTIVPWDEIPDRFTLPHDIYTLQAEQLQVTHSGRTGNLMIAAEFSVVAPVAYAGLTVREWYVLGNENDPEAADPETWKRQTGARNLRRLVKAMGTPMDPELENSMALAVGQRFDALVTQQTETDGDYAGQIRNRVQAYYPCGEQVPGSMSATAGQPAPRPTAPARPASAAAPPPRAPAAPRPVRPPTRPLNVPSAAHLAQPLSVAPGPEGLTPEYPDEPEEPVARPPMPARPGLRRY